MKLLSNVDHTTFVVASLLTKKALFLSRHKIMIASVSITNSSQTSFFISFFFYFPTNTLCNFYDTSEFLFTFFNKKNYIFIKFFNFIFFIFVDFDSSTNRNINFNK